VECLIIKAIAYGALTVLKDFQGCGAKTKITDDAEGWVISLACRSPKELDY